MALGLVLFALCAAVLAPLCYTSHCDQLAPNTPSQGECEHIGTKSVQLTLQCRVVNCENFTNVTWHLVGLFQVLFYKYDPSHTHSSSRPAGCVTSSGLLVFPGDELNHPALTSTLSVNCRVYREDDTLCGLQKFNLTVLSKLLSCIILTLTNFSSLGLPNTRPRFGETFVKTTGFEEILRSETIDAVVGHSVIVCIRGATDGLSTDKINWQHNNEPIRNLTSITEWNELANPRCLKLIENLAYDQPVSTHLIAYRSQPCIAILDSFYFVMRIHEIEFSDEEKYSINMAARTGYTQKHTLTIKPSKFVMVINELNVTFTLGYAQINPQAIQTPSSVNNVLTNGSNALYHCAIKTSIDSTDHIQWVNSSRLPLPALNITCPASNLDCVCTNRFGVYNLHHPPQDTLDSIGRLKILNVSLVVCNATIQLAGHYICTYASAMNVTMVNISDGRTLPDALIFGQLIGCHYQCSGGDCTDTDPWSNDAVHGHVCEDVLWKREGVHSIWTDQCYRHGYQQRHEIT